MLVDEEGWLKKVAAVETSGLAFSTAPLFHGQPIAGDALLVGGTLHHRRHGLPDKYTVHRGDAVAGSPLSSRP